MYKYICITCGKEFNQKSQYTTHLRNKLCITETKLVKDIATSKITIAKPILKWVGGKTQILDKIIPDFQ
jgi:DNA-directed RNA polymerase subunit RPC12/RpoP